MLQAFFHAWERRLASVTTDRVVRPSDWGLDWLSENGHGDGGPVALLEDWVSSVMADTDRFFAIDPAPAYAVSAMSNQERLLTFASALETPHPENNTVYCRFFTPRRAAAAQRAAVLVLPQWNADPDGHVGL